MIFSFKNIGIIEEAEIDLKGLTVITGLNDTGKSFLSKSIYSIIKSVSESSEQESVEKEEQLRNIIQQIFSLHRQLVAFTPHKQQEFNPNLFIVKIAPYLFNKSYEELTTSLFNEYKERVIKDIKDNTPTSLRPNVEPFLERINSIAISVISALKEDSNEEKRLKNFFDKIIIQKLFQGQISSFYSKEKSLEIKIKDGATELLNISVKDNQTISFKINSPLLQTDATIVDTPTIIQLTKFITTSLAFPGNIKKLYRQRTELPYPYYDLIEKMNKSGGATMQPYSAIFDETREIIKGTFEFKVEEGWIVFQKEDGNVVRAFNIATGVKSFGLIQLLLSSETINPNSILIIDEPEVHLHPKWEIEYAKIIVALSKIGIPIVVSSHSPYFIRALTVYVKEFSTENITNFYFGEKIEGKSTTQFRKVEGDLEPIFKLLSEPMHDLFLNN